MVTEQNVGASVPLVLDGLNHHDSRQARYWENVPESLETESGEAHILGRSKPGRFPDWEKNRGTFCLSPHSASPHSVPAFPGAPRRMSVQGHQELLDEKIQNLANRAHEYNQKCGGGDPFGGGAAASVPSASPSTAPSICPGVKLGLIVVGGAIIVGGTVILCPECLALAPAFAF